jgi:hypothetical protein
MEHEFRLGTPGLVLDVYDLARLPTICAKFGSQCSNIKDRLSRSRQHFTRRETK